MTQPVKRIPRWLTIDVAGDRHIAGDYRDRHRDRGCSLATNMNRADRHAARVRTFRPARRRRFADVALADRSSQTNGW